MFEYDYKRLVDITKDYYDGKCSYDYMKNYWNWIHSKKEEEVGAYSVEMWCVANTRSIVYGDNEWSCEKPYWVSATFN